MSLVNFTDEERYLTDEERYNLLNSEEKKYAGSGVFDCNDV